ncbi:hypothetical protein GE061_008494, partial [Apolygus lucorum]
FSDDDYESDHPDDRALPIEDTGSGPPTQASSLRGGGTGNVQVPIPSSPEFAGFSPPAEGVTPAIEAENLHSDKDLAPDLLQALGENPLVSVSPAPALHSSIVNRWEHHIQHGISLESFNKLKEIYVVPSNLQLLGPPQLNPEISASIGSAQKAIDTQYVTLQRQCAIAVTALGMGLSKIIDQGTEVASALGPSYQHLCDAGRAMTALFFDINRTRRRLIQNVCSSALTTISRDVPSTHLLFGNDLGARFSAHKGMESNGKGLVAPIKETAPSRFPRSQQPQRHVSLQRKNSGNGRGRAAQRGGQFHNRPKSQPFYQQPARAHSRGRGGYRQPSRGAAQHQGRQ